MYVRLISLNPLGRTLIHNIIVYVMCYVYLHVCQVTRLVKIPDIAMLEHVVVAMDSQEGLVKLVSIYSTNQA